MGRPINKKFFGNLNRPYNNFATGGATGVGGESVATISISNSGTLYSQGTVVTLGAPNITGGIPATVNTNITPSGNVAVSILNSGTGYTSTSILSITTASRQSKTIAAPSLAGSSTIYVNNLNGVYVGMKVIGSGISASSTYVTSTVAPGQVNLTWPNATTVTGAISFLDVGTGFAATVNLTNNTQNALKIITYLTTGSSAVSGGDILKQESSRRYLVQNSQGRGVVKLSAGTGTNHVLEPGGMHLIATDFGGATYYVTKLTSRRVTLINRTGTSTALITLVTDAAGVKTGSARWTLGAATGTIVTLSNV